MICDAWPQANAKNRLLLSMTTTACESLRWRRRALGLSWPVGGLYRL